MTESTSLRPVAPTATADEPPINILIVEDEGIVAQDLIETIARLGYRVAGVASEGVQAACMAEELQPHLILMDVGLRGDIDGIQAAQMIQERLHLPIVFLTGHHDLATLERAVRIAPLGYLVKPFQEVELRCAIEVAVHRHRTEIAMREREEALRQNAELMSTLSLSDELTQLRNRRGFFEVAEQALKIARRERHVLGLFFVDLNGLKQINDNLGHAVGDRALRDTADILRRTFREADLIARLGGDEFVVLAHVQSDTSVIRERLREHLAELNAQHDRPYTLDVSIGTTLVNAASSESIEELIAQADADMYEEKRASTGVRYVGDLSSILKR